MTQLKEWIYLGNDNLIHAIYYGVQTANFVLLCINPPHVINVSNFMITEAAFPRFAEPIPNVTVTIGRDALLACVVENLRGFKASN